MEKILPVSKKNKQKSKSKQNKTKPKTKTKTTTHLLIRCHNHAYIPIINNAYLENCCVFNSIKSG